MDIVGLTDLASDIGALGLSIIIIWALLTDRIVTRGRLDEMRQQRDSFHDELEIERARHEHIREP
jgi:hypothetical protein